MRYVIDTNIWIKLLRKERRVRACVARALDDDRNELIITPVAYYEVLRGLVKRGDTESVDFIRALRERLRYVEATRAVWDEAVRLWVLAVRRNRKQEDADTLTAAFASVLEGTIVTVNEAHFAPFGLATENWAT